MHLDVSIAEVYEETPLPAKVREIAEGVSGVVHFQCFSSRWELVQKKKISLDTKNSVYSTTGLVTLPPIVPLLPP